jgi:hypothetical protein
MADEPTLRYGDRESDGWVKYLQQLLIVDETGVFDDATLAAVRDVQTARNLVPDGVVGDQTWASVRNDPAHPPATDGLAPHTHLEKGSRAEWYSDTPEHFYDAGEDSAGAFAVNVGALPIASGASVQAVITKPDGQKVTRDDAQLKAQDREPAEPGDLLFCGLDNLKAELGSGTHHVDLTLPADLGGQSTSFSFTIE